jgi:cell division protein ZapA (FtsZ GTPase activity inhibitor)
MGSDTELVIFNVCGQEFRIRSPREDAERTRRIAADVCERVRTHRERGGVSDVRAVLMACYELAYELDERNEVLSKIRSHDKAIDSAKVVMDRLLDRLEEELASHVPSEDADPAQPGGNPRPAARQLDLTGLEENEKTGKKSGKKKS